MQVKAPIEAIDDRAEVALSMLAEAEGVVYTGETGLNVAEDRVYPVEHGQFLGFTTTDDCG